VADVTNDDGAGQQTELSWEAGREAKTMEQGLELADLALSRLGLKRQEWTDSVNLVSPWKYTNVPFGNDDQMLRVGVSSGGVVSVDRDPFTPGDRQMNVTLANVERSLSERIELAQRLLNQQRTATEAWVRRHEQAASNEALGRIVAPLVGAKLEQDDEVAFVLSPDLKRFPIASIASPMQAGAFSELGRIARDAWANPEHHLRKTMPSEVLKAVGTHVLMENSAQPGQTMANPVENQELIPERKSMSTNPYDPEKRESVYARFVVENGVSLDDDELERVYGNTVLPDFCIKFMQADRADGVTAEAVYEALNVRHLMGRGQDEREFLETLIRETGIEPVDAVSLSGKLQVLSAAHLKLNTMDHNEGLTSDQSAARDEIEERVRSLVADLKGMGEPTFRYDGRGPAVRLSFDSGISNSFASGWIVPLKDDAAGSLPPDFWQQYVPTSPQSELVDLLVQAGNDREVVAEKVERLVTLAAQHTKMAEELSEVDADLANDDGFVAVKEDLRDQMRGIANELVGVKGVEFGMDARFSTVALELESGRKNRMSGGWFVPVQDALETVEQGFWRDLAPEAEAADDDRFVVLSITNTDNAAFVDVGREFEMARIIKEAAASVASMSEIGDINAPLRDINGNKVGKFECTETLPEGELEHGAARLVIKTGTIPSEGDGILRDSADRAEVARILREAAHKVGNGDHDFSLRDANGNVVGKFEFRESPSLEKDGVIDMSEALMSGRVYLAEEGYSGIADGEYRYVVTTEDFEPGYGQGEGEVWLVNAKGETAPGYEDPQTVREVLFGDLGRDHKSDLIAVVEGRMAFEDFERKMSGDSPELG
jgi:hypothetical protein